MLPNDLALSGQRNVADAGQESSQVRNAYSARSYEGYRAAGESYCCSQELAALLNHRPRTC